MRSFIQRLAGSIHGVLSGFDRIRFRGTQRLIATVHGLSSYLAYQRILLKDFKSYVTGVTEQILTQTKSQALAQGVPIHYVNDSQVSKEDLAAEWARTAVRGPGLQAILSAVEPCRTFFVRKNPTSGHLELQCRPGKCLHYYHYWRDAVLGPCHLRVQTWFPFNVFVCVNGREMLAERLDRAGVGYRKRDNCFPWIEDLTTAQRLVDEQVRLDWSAQLTRLLTASHPDWSSWPAMERPYYWSADQTEWATDVMFRSPSVLARRMPGLVHYSLEALGAGDVLRFLGRPVPVGERPHQAFKGEATTEWVKRPEGVRVRFRVNRNAVKVYDKQGSVLRVETTINDARDLRSYRTKEGEPDGPKTWRPMKKGVSDLPRRAQVSQKCNERCLEALAAADDPRTLGELTRSICRPAKWKGRSVRALNPFADADLALLRTVTRGEFLLHGFRNRDLRAALYSQPAADAPEERRRSAAVTRRLRILRGHHLIAKIPHTHRYQLTATGRAVIAALLTAHAAAA